MITSAGIAVLFDLIMTAEDQGQWVRIVQPMAHHIANSQGEPITDRQERLQKILEMDLKSNLDPGHDFSVLDADIARARAGGIEQFSQRQKGKSTS